MSDVDMFKRCNKCGRMIESLMGEPECKCFPVVPHPSSHWVTVSKADKAEQEN